MWYTDHGLFFEVHVAIANNMETVLTLYVRSVDMYREVHDNYRKDVPVLLVIDACRVHIACLLCPFLCITTPVSLNCLCKRIIMLCEF